MKKLYALFILAMASSAPALAQWNTNATPKCIFGLDYTDPETGEAKQGGDYYACSPQVARTADKKTWIAWRTWGKKKVNGINRSAVRTFLQLLDRDGNPQFSEPIMVNDYSTTTYWSKYGLAVAADGSAIVTVADGRSEEATLSDDQEHPDGFSPAIYKIDQEGNFLWGLDGVEFRQFTNAAYTNCFVVGEDTYFTFFNTTYDDSGIAEDMSNIGTFIMRINDDGTCAWEQPKHWSNEFIQPQILPSTDGEFLLFDKSPDGSLVHRMNRELEEVWGEPVIYDDNYYGGYEMNHYRIVSDGEGGACVAFQRFMGQFSHNIRVQHINADGSLGFGLTGLDAYNAEEYDHNYPSIAANAETKEILVQFASDLGSTGEIRHQKFNYDGDYLYDERGMTVASKDPSTSNGYMFSVKGIGALPDGNWVAIYHDLAGYDRASIILRWYDKDGNRTMSKTIGRDLGISDMSYFVEPEAIYLFYRETRPEKAPGITIFRIGIDGTYNVTYPDTPTGISDVHTANQQAQQVFDLNGRQLSQPQRGLNIIRKADGSVVKQLR